MYAVIDRRNWKVVEVASSRNKLTSHGLVVNTEKPELLAPEDLLTAYKNLVGNRGLRRPTPEIAARLAEAVAEASKGLTQGEPLEGPVALARRVCNSMRGNPRKEVIAECVKQGINPNTARTQYQRWFHSHKPVAPRGKRNNHVQ